MATTLTQPAHAAPTHERPIRVVTATSLFDGHDAAINVMRRVMQDLGAEVIHLGHNRSAAEVVRAAIEEDADALAVSSYQGGHMEYFTYVLELLREAGAGHIQVFGGGGGTIVPREIAELHEAGVARIYSPEDGRRLGLEGMLADLIAHTAAARRPIDFEAPLDLGDRTGLARALTTLEAARLERPEMLDSWRSMLRAPATHAVPVLGVTGTGGAGKSSLVDELVLRFVGDFRDKRVAVLSVDPTRRRTGGALLGDRIRMNMAGHDRVFVRSLATRARGGEISDALPEAIAAMKAAGYDLIIAETAGIGQGDARIVDLCDLALYVMTPEYGAASQLEKIDMIDLADAVAINKFDRAGADDALRDVRKQVQRSKRAFSEPLEAMPVFGTMASRFNDDGVRALYHGLVGLLNDRLELGWQSRWTPPAARHTTQRGVVIPPERVRYLADIARCVREYHAWAEAQAELAEEAWRLAGAEVALPEGDARHAVAAERASVERALDARSVALLEAYARLREAYAQDELVYHVRGRELRAPLYKESLSGTRLPRVAMPRYRNPGDQLRYMLREGVPGNFPFTAGVFPLKRTDEDATRMFAGEGDARRTNLRFKYLSVDSPAKRLSTAFDSVTLYGWDPEPRPDILGKVGTSGVSIATLDDMRQLYDGFDLCAPNTSVSMTINGPAPTILAFFLNTAIDQQRARFEAEQGRTPTEEEDAQLQAHALRSVRGTVQADILKEDQGQNTCIFAIDFALKMMGDIQQYFIDNEVRNFYSVSISGYHIAEAGANPISQLAFTLANGLTYVEYYLARGMDVNDFAPNLSFFFSCGMDPEYTVLNRVARRIWAIALRERYGANERAQKLKTHIQTSGRSLHAQEIAFNDIRTTLEALMSYYDHCNSLHTNAFDEAITTPTEASVRRALAIQQIIAKEHGLAYCENPLQGSYVVEELTDLVEEAVLREFERISERGGVLGAMERGYQRGKIQDESLHYEHLKSSGAHPIVGVNTFVDPDSNADEVIAALELRRGTEEEKQGQLERVRAFQAEHRAAAGPALERLQDVCCNGGNIFAELMHATRVCTLGQITRALFEVGGQYRRNT